MSLDEAMTFYKKEQLEEKKYIVKEGDVLGTIANDHDLKYLISLL